MKYSDSAVVEGGSSAIVNHILKSLSYLLFLNSWLLWDNRYWTYPVWSALSHLLQLWRISGCCKCICSCLHLANWNRWWSTEIVFYIAQYQIWRLSIFHYPRREYPLENNDIFNDLKYPKHFVYESHKKWLSRNLMLIVSSNLF